MSGQILHIKMLYSITSETPILKLDRTLLIKHILYVKLQRFADHFRPPLNFTNVGISPVIATGK